MSDHDLTIPMHDPEGGVRRRRRWPWVLLIVVVVLAALAVAAELVARSILPGVVRSVVIEQLDLPADQQLDVEAGGILIPQLLGGRLDSLHLSTDSVTLGEITGAVDLTATAVPLQGGELGPTSGTVRIDEAQFTTLLASSELPVEKVSFADRDATVSGSVSILGRSVPLALTVAPGVQDGDLLLTPKSLTVGGAVVDADRVASLLGSLGERLTAPQRVCIADRIPAGVTLTGLRIDGSEAVIDLDLDGAIVTDAALQENGVCPQG